MADSKTRFVRTANRIMATTLAVFAAMYFVGSLSAKWLGFIFGTATLLGPPVIALGLLAGLAAVGLHVAGSTDFWGD